VNKSQQPPGPDIPRKKSHAKTGRPPGGRRPGAGRPPGARNKLRAGEVAALKSLRWRVPEGTPEPIAALADEALEQIQVVMRKPVPGSRERLSAARAIREEICGPVKQQVEHSGGVRVTWSFDPTGGSDAPAQTDDSTERPE
jgi:hypothetical protein